MRECREPDMERACEFANAPARFWPEFERFIALEGIGIADMFGLIPPSVCRERGVVRVCLREVLGATACLLTSRWRRTENMCVSCDMLSKIEYRTRDCEQ